MMKAWLSLVIALAASAAGWVGVGAEPGPSTVAAKPLNYFIVITGGELLEGVYPDAHTPFLTRALRPLGCQCIGSMTVDDNREDIQRALRYATNLAPLVVVTGGLGPTPNDITRQTLSEFTGIPLREDEDVLGQMSRRVNQTLDQLRPNLRRQAMVPVRGGHLKNANGTAAGLIFDVKPGVVIALPGPPRELQPMVEGELVPFLRERFGVREFGCSLTLRFVGAGQSLIDQTIKDHVSVAPDVVITSLFEGSRVDFTFSLPGHEQAGRQRLKKLEDSIREHLAEYIYADDGSTLEDVIVARLKAQAGSLVLVEVGSGGSVAAALSGAKLSTSVLSGAFVAPTAAVMARLLKIPAADLPQGTAEQLKALARGAVAQTGSTCAVAVGPVEQDDKGAPTVWVAYRLRADRWETQRLSLRDIGEIRRATLTTQILDYLRRHL